LSFSPVNQLLLCTSGLNNRIHFFDIQEGREVKKIDTGTPLSSLAFCGDGHTVAVGTISGRVLLYDLKDAKKIKLELKGHENKKIKCLQFSKTIKSNPSTDQDRKNSIKSQITNPASEGTQSARPTSQSVKLSSRETVSAKHLPSERESSQIL
jgi:protein NEDD1